MVGDDLNTIASGPTVPDPTTFQNAFEICQKYGILSRKSDKEYVAKTVEVPENYYRNFDLITEEDEDI